MSTAVWTGGAGSADRTWGNPENWQGDVVPTAGQDVDFPASVGGTTISVTTNVTVGNLSMDASHYQLSTTEANGVTPTYLTVDGNITATGTDLDIGNLVLGHSATITVNAGGVLGLESVSDGGDAYGITKEGTGDMYFDQDSTYTGVTQVEAGTADVEGPVATSFVVAAGATLEGASTQGAITDNGGTFIPAESGEYPFNDTSSGADSFGSGSTFDEEIASYGAGKLTATGPSVSLTGCALEIFPESFAPSVGTVYTVISNGTGSAVTGTFTGLPQGATTEADGVYYQISYDGGESGHDVTLTAVNAPPTVVSVMPAATTTSQTALSIIGADPGTDNDSDLTYTWSVAHAPSGAKPVTFGTNGTNAAQSSSAVFHKAGTYHLLCTIASTDGEFTTQLVSVRVNQVATKLELAPHKKVMAAGAKVQYSGVVLDQFKHAIATTSISYAVETGAGTISDAGLFTAGEDPGHVVIKITVDGLTGTLGATIV